MKAKVSSSELLVVNHLQYARLWFWIGVALIMAIVMVSLIKIPAPVSKFMLNDKLLHCAVYACLMGWFGQIFRNRIARLGFAFMFVMMGVVVEFVQGMMPFRHFEVLDMIANASGVLLAWALCHTWVGSILEWFERTVIRSSSSMPVEQAS